MKYQSILRFQRQENDIFTDKIVIMWVKPSLASYTAKALLHLNVCLHKELQGFTPDAKTDLDSSIQCCIRSALKVPSVSSLVRPLTRFATIPRLSTRHSEEKQT